MDFIISPFIITTGIIFSLILHFILIDLPLIFIGTNPVKISLRNRKDINGMFYILQLLLWTAIIFAMITTALICIPHTAADIISGNLQQRSNILTLISATLIGMTIIQAIEYSDIKVRQMKVRKIDQQRKQEKVKIWIAK